MYVCASIQSISWRRDNNLEPYPRMDGMQTSQSNYEIIVNEYMKCVCRCRCICVCVWVTTSRQTNELNKDIWKELEATSDVGRNHRSESKFLLPQSTYLL